MNTQKFESAQAHKDEIVKTRTGFLGGSDAAMVFKIGSKGLAAMTRTDRDRLLVLVGRKEYKPVPENEAMRFGHAFEDWAEKNPIRQLNEENGHAFVREVRLGGSDFYKYNNFSAMAHADFYDEKSGRVVECKFSQCDTDRVEYNYFAQLQYYYVLGASDVVLLHGYFGGVNYTGGGKIKTSVDPCGIEIEPAGIAFRHIDRDEQVIEILLRGLELIDDYITDGLLDDSEPVDVSVVDIPKDKGDIVRGAFEKMALIKKAEDALATMREELRDYMEANNIVKIDHPDCTISLIGKSVKRTFNTRKAQADFPELKGDEYYTTAEVKAFVKIALKK